MVSDPGDEKLADLKRWFESSEEASRDAFNKMERDQDYYDSKQLTQTEYDTLTQRGQPPIAINLIRRKVDFLLGMEAQQRSDPKAYPRTPQDAQSAEVVTDALRYIGDWNDYSYSRARAWRDLLVVGIGGFQIDMKRAKKPPLPQVQMLGFPEANPDICIKRNPWDRMWWDQHSTEPDFSDAMHRGLVVWRDADEVIRQYGPESESIVKATIDKASRTDQYDDKPRYRAWADSHRQRVRIVQCYWKEGDQCHWAEYTEQGILAGGESPWIDTDGDSQDPFVWRSAYVDRDGNRHGIVRDMIDPQDEVNKRRSKALHLLTMRQVSAEKGAVDDIEKAKRELARPDGFIERNPGMALDVLDNMDLSNGQMQLLQHATAEIEKMGPNAALQGTGEQEQSGRAIQARQQGGMVELGQLLDHLRSMDREVYEKSWARAKQFWKAPQFIRVTDRDDAPQFVGLNEPMIDPRNGMPVGMQNNVAELDVDLVIDQGPDVAVIQQEVWEVLTNTLPMLAQLPPPLQKVAIEAMPYPASEKKKLIEALEGGQQGPDPMQQQLQQAQIEMAMRKGAAEIQKTESEAQRNQAAAERDKANAYKAVVDANTPPPQPVARQVG